MTAISLIVDLKNKLKIIVYRDPLPAGIVLVRDMIELMGQKTRLSGQGVFKVFYDLDLDTWH